MLVTYHSHLFLLMAATKIAFGQTSLFIPGFDNQALSVADAGVNANGETTWDVYFPSPTYTGADAGPSDAPTMVQLVEGSSDAYLSLSYDLAEYFESCVLSAGMAYCDVVVSSPGLVISTQTTQVVSYMSVEGGAPASPTPIASTTSPNSGQTGTGLSSAGTPASTAVPANSASPPSYPAAAGVFISTIALVLFSTFFYY